MASAESPDQNASSSHSEHVHTHTEADRQGHEDTQTDGDARTQPLTDRLRHTHQGTPVTKVAAHPRADAPA